MSATRGCDIPNLLSKRQQSSELMTTMVSISHTQKKSLHTFIHQFVLWLHIYIKKDHFPTTNELCRSSKPSQERVQSKIGERQGKDNDNDEQHGKMVSHCWVANPSWCWASNSDIDWSECLSRKSCEIYRSWTYVLPFFHPLSAPSSTTFLVILPCFVSHPRSPQHHYFRQQRHAWSFSCLKGESILRSWHIHMKQKKKANAEGTTTHGSLLLGASAAKWSTLSVLFSPQEIHPIVLAAAQI